MAIPKKRYEDIGNTRIGYNYIKSAYYITTFKDEDYRTTTYRDDLKIMVDLIQALQILPDTEEEIRAKLLEFSSGYEDLEKVSYTWQDNGAYIRTIQFNDYKSYPLVIDCEKSIIYILNSNIIYDLTLNESPKVVRVPHFVNYYKDVIGLNIEEQDMRFFYDLLTAYYEPTCYNQIASRKNDLPLRYSNIFMLSNYDTTSPATYVGTTNPLGTTSPSNTKYNNIISINNETGMVTTLEEINQAFYKGGNAIIQGTDTVISDSAFTDDGNYTIDNIEDNTMLLSTLPPISYNVYYKTLYLHITSSDITKIDSLDNSITLSGKNTKLKVSDTIRINNTTISDGYNKITDDGNYTIGRIEEINDSYYILYVSEIIPYVFTSGTQTGKVIKEELLGNICNIENNTITLTNLLSHAIPNESTVYIHDNENISEYTTQGQAQKGQPTIQVTSTPTAPTAWTPTYAKLCFPEPSQEVLLNITTVKESMETQFPIGEFMVDNMEQAIQYLSTCTGLITPTDINTKLEEYIVQKPIEENLNAEVPTEITFKKELISGIESMTLQGLYSEIYPTE